MLKPQVMMQKSQRNLFAKDPKGFLNGTSLLPKAKMQLWVHFLSFTSSSVGAFFKEEVGPNDDI